VLEAVAVNQETDWIRLVEGAAWTLVELARRRLGDAADARRAQSMFATTLTVALVVPIDSQASRVTGVSVGDSAAWTLRASGLTCIGGGKNGQNDDEPFSSVVTALPAVPSSLDIFESQILNGDVLLVMSDGVGDPLGDGSGLLGGLLKQQLRIPPPLLQLARIADFSRETFTDDRTLVAVWPFDRMNVGHGQSS